MMTSFTKAALWGFASLLCFGLAFWVAHNAGYKSAEVKGQAALAVLEARHAEEEAARWAVVAEAERKGRERLQAEQTRADALTAQLQETETTLASERRAFTKRIADATRNAPVLTAESVRLYNEALYGPAAGAGGGNKAGDSASAAYGAGTAPASGGRVLPEQPVTLADLLAHARDYGGWCRTLQARERAWVDLRLRTR